MDELLVKSLFGANTDTDQYLSVSQPAISQIERSNIMLTVHHLGRSQSERIVWLCEELAIPYQLIHYTRDPVTSFAPASYRSLTPMGIAPVITDGDLVMGESGAIVDYIIHIYGGGSLAVVPGQPHYAEYLFWFHFSNGTIIPSEMMRMVPTALGLPESHPGLSFFTSRAEKGYTLLEVQLGKSLYLAGNDLTAADIMMLFPLTTLRAFVPRDLSSFPHIQAYLKRIGERPAYQRAMAKGDPGSPLLLE